MSDDNIIFFPMNRRVLENGFDYSTIREGNLNMLLLVDSFLNSLFSSGLQDILISEETFAELNRLRYDLIREWARRHPPPPPPPQETWEPEQPQQPTSVYRVTADVLNIRPKAGVNLPRVGYFNRGELVEVTAGVEVKNAGYYWMELADGRGWVARATTNGNAYMALIRL